MNYLTAEGRVELKPFTASSPMVPNLFLLGPPRFSTSFSCSVHVNSHTPNRFNAVFTPNVKRDIDRRIILSLHAAFLLYSAQDEKLASFTQREFASIHVFALTLYEIAPHGKCASRLE